MSKRINESFNRVLDILKDRPKISTNAVIVEYWRRYIRDSFDTLGSYERDFEADKIPVSTIDRYYRKVRESHPNICLDRSEKREEEFRETFKKSNRMIQGAFL